MGGRERWSTSPPCHHCLLAYYYLFLLAPQSDAHTIAPHRDPIHTHPYPSNPTYSSRAKNGQTEQDQNAGVRFTTQNCEFMNNLFRKKLLQDNEKVYKLYKKRCE